MCNVCGTYPNVPDKARRNMHQDSNVVSIRLVLLIILASSVPCSELRLQSTAGI